MDAACIWVKEMGGIALDVRVFVCRIRGVRSGFFGAVGAWGRRVTGLVSHRIGVAGISPRPAPAKKCPEQRYSSATVA